MQNNLLFIIWRFPFNQNVWFEFLATSSSERNSIFQNFQKGAQPRELYLACVA